MTLFIYPKTNKMRIPFILLILSLYLKSFSQGGTFVPKKVTPPAAVTPSKQTVKKNPTQHNSVGTVLIVSPETVPCSNNSSSQCLQIKKQGSTEYETVEDIENFNYDIGYTYTIQVKEIMKTPPIGVGESIYRYVWIKTISKKELVEETAKTETINNIDLTPKTTYQATYNNGKVIGQTNIITDSELDKKWYLRKLKDVNGESLVTDDNVMWIEIKTFNDRIEGFGSCNKFWTVVKSDLNTTFEVSKLTTNYAQCGYKKLEDLFYDLLQKANRFEIRNGNLILSDQWKFLLGFTSNPNNKEDIAITYTSQNIIKNDEMTYATSKKSEDKYVPPIQVTTTTETTTSSQSVITSTTPIVPIPENNTAKVIEDEKEKEIAELKRKAEEQTKIIEELRKQELIKKQEVQKIDSISLKTDKKIESIIETSNSKIPEKKQNNPNAPTTSSYPPIKIIPYEESKPVLTNNSIITENNITDNSEFPEPKTSNIVYYKDENKLLYTEIGDAIFRGTDKNTNLEISAEESKIQFAKNKIPKLIIKTDGVKPSLDYISLYKCDFKKEKRQIYVRPSKNRILTSFSEIAPNIYEIILPENLGEGEYIFVNQSDLNKPVTYNTSTARVFCFGVGYK